MLSIWPVDWLVSFAVGLLLADMISPFVRILIKPILRMLDAQLERLLVQIRDGQRDEAMTTVTELRQALNELRNKFDL